MNPETILAIVKKFLPTKKILAYILSAAVALAATALGLNQDEIKKSYCESKIEVDK